MRRRSRSRIARRSPSSFWIARSIRRSSCSTGRARSGFQNCTFPSAGKVTTPILVRPRCRRRADRGRRIHERRQHASPAVSPDPITSWQKRGRLRVYLCHQRRGAGTGRLSRGDPLLARSARVRERAQRRHQQHGDLAPAPRADARPRPVDVVDQELRRRLACRAVGRRDPLQARELQRRGKLWLLGNIMSRCGAASSSRAAPPARRSSRSATSSRIRSAFAVTGACARSLALADLWNHFYWSGLTDRSAPASAGTNAHPCAGVLRRRPVAAARPLPAALARPTVAAALPGMLDVKTVRSRRRRCGRRHGRAPGGIRRRLQRQLSRSSSSFPPVPTRSATRCASITTSLRAARSATVVGSRERGARRPRS